LQEQTLVAFHARFKAPLILATIHDTNSAMRLIADRVQEAYEKGNFSSPYPTWPFTPQFFESARDIYPRVLLQGCDAHRNLCVAENQVIEAKNFPTGPRKIDPEPVPLRLDGLYSDILQKTENILFDENNEDGIISDLLRVALDCLIQENPLSEDVDAVIDTSFVGGRNFPVLNVRTRLIYRNEGDREKHLCLKALERTNAVAYQNRLNAAMTASGIDRALSFRKLMIVRTRNTPGGAVTQALTEKFTKAGGVFVKPTSDEFRVLSSLQELRKQNDPDFNAWLRHHRRVSALPFLQPATAWLFDDESHKNNGQPKVAEIEKAPEPKANGFVGVVIKSVEPVLKKSTTMPIGFRLIGKQTKELISIPVQDLTKHTVILAGSGSGKTVLVRRIVEEAALLGIPSIVIDAANDLARMGDRWPAPPEAWREEDQKKADLYHEKSRVTVWTPGRESGNPLNLEPLPDLAPLINDEEELEQATTMALDSLRSLVAAGNSRAASLKQGVLKAALDYFARNAGGRLPELLTLLSDLPEEAGGGITDAAKKAREMADDLRAAMLKDPLLRQSGATIDPAVLFGLSPTSAKTQISIINFIGIQSTSAQQQFLNQLFMTLFTWIKRNPAPPENPVRGLLVLDEAKDIIPSTGSTPCKASLNRLAAQARKYGLGIIFATQAPKSIDHNIIANCSTQFYGRANSPASIDVIREQMRQRGGNGDDVARLERGQFYSVTESLKAPCKLSMPLCLSSHLPTPLDEAEVLKRSQDSRNEI
jgi:hypothetical protein